jgi:hypothetical protein
MTLGLACKPPLGIAGVSLGCGLSAKASRILWPKPHEGGNSCNHFRPKSGKHYRK